MHKIIGSLTPGTAGVPQTESIAKEQPGEQNAAPQPKHLVRRGLKPDGTYPLSDDDEPAAPDVAAMVKRLNDYAERALLHECLPAMREAAALIEKLGQGWIPVSSPPPDNSGQLLVWDGERVSNAEFPHGWHSGLKAHTYITHWMPLPPPPERP